jgi:hypothetical protein
VARLELGDSTGAFADMDRFAAVADELGQPLCSWYVPLWRGFRAQLRGDVPAMIAAAREARELGGRAGSRNAAALSYVQESWAAGEEDRLAEQLPVMLEMLGVLPELAPDGATYVALFPGQPDHVVRSALPGLAEMVDGLPVDFVRLSGLCHAAVSLVEGRDEPEHCDVVHARLLPYAGLVAVDGIAAGTHGVTDRLLAMLAHASGRLEEAEEHARAAVAGNARFGSRLHVAYSEGVLAGVLAGRGAAQESHRLFEHAQSELLAMGLDRRARWYAERYPVDPVDPGSAAVEPVGTALARHGEVWTLTYAGRAVTLTDSKGLADLAVLLTRPGHEVHVLDLDGGGRADTRAAVAAGGDLGEVLDDRARREYAERLATIEADLADAEDDGRDDEADRLREEREALLSALRSAYGLGGRARRTGGEAERARSRVTRRLKETLARVEQQHPEAGRHLRASVRTGVFCRYEPERDVRWQVTT